VAPWSEILLTFSNALYVDTFKRLPLTHYTSLQIEGLTEFLPVSSTGHMIIGSSFMGIADEDFTKLFTIFILVLSLGNV
jgi:hypothetical protein